MTRKIIDCRQAPSEMNCTLTFAGEPDEVLAAATHHAVTIHGHDDGPHLQEMLRDAMTDAPESVSGPGAFVQLVEFGTDRVEQWEVIAERLRTAIGTERASRWHLVGSDRDRPQRYVAIVEFPSYARAMAMSAHPATDTFAKELREICETEPTFRNLDVSSAQPY